MTDGESQAEQEQERDEGDRDEGDRDEGDSPDEGGTSGNGDDDRAAGQAEAGEEARLEEVGEHIQRARDQAKDMLGEPDRELNDSGETPEEDDQAIAPPG
ncbi:MAG: hypothetical protein ACRD12_19010 [Acidimicrobiales bacterium]